MHANWVLNCSFHSLTNNDAQRFAFGGGLFSEMRKCTGPAMECHDGFLLVCFYGENVRCHSAVLSISSFFREDKISRLDNFMKEVRNAARDDNRSAGNLFIFSSQTREALGGIDVKTQQRVAFVFRCSGIGPPFSAREKRVYYDYFPDTPAFDFTSNGEYGISHLTDCSGKSDALELAETNCPQ